MGNNRPKLVSVPEKNIYRERDSLYEKQGFQVVLPSMHPICCLFQALGRAKHLHQPMMVNSWILAYAVIQFEARDPASHLTV